MPAFWRLKCVKCFFSSLSHASVKMLVHKWKAVDFFPFFLESLRGFVILEEKYIRIVVAFSIRLFLYSLETFCFGPLIRTS